MELSTELKQLLAVWKNTCAEHDTVCKADEHDTRLYNLQSDKLCLTKKVIDAIRPHAQMIIDLYPLAMDILYPHRYEKMF